MKRFLKPWKHITNDTLKSNPDLTIDTVLGIKALLESYNKDRDKEQIFDEIYSMYILLNGRIKK